MKKVHAGCLLVAAFAGMSFAQTGVAISGRVTDTNGVGLPGAIVRLATLALETETDTNGNYALGSATLNVRSLLTAKTGAYSKPILSSGKVLFTVGDDNARVRVSVYDLSGRFVSDLLNRRLNSGDYSVVLDGRNIAVQPYVLNVNINGASHTMKFTPVGLRAYSGSPTESAGSFPRLEKAMVLNDTIKVTKPGYSIGNLAADVSGGIFNFTLKKTSTWNGDTASFWGNASTYPTSGIQYVILNRTNGAWPDSKIYWSDQQGGTKVQLSQQSTFHATANGRFYIWIAPNDSGGRYFDFMEININGLSWYGNTTRVDGWRLPITFRVHNSKGKDTALGDSYEMFYQPRKAKFDEFVNESPKEFIGLATHDFANIWAPHTSPVNIFGKNGPYVDYYNAYLDSVWLVRNYTIAKPTAIAIFGCMPDNAFPGSLDMSSRAPLASALTRHVATLDSATIWQNDAYYYKAPPCNYFSKWCHRRSIHNLCYGFAYDDYGTHDAFAALDNVQWVAIAIGW
jgi:Beta-1,3-glucanase